MYGQPVILNESEQPEEMFYGLGYFSSVLLASNSFNRWLN